MDSREKSGKELQYMPMRRSREPLRERKTDVVRSEKVENRRPEKNKKQKERKTRKIKKIAGITTLAALGISAVVLTGAKGLGTLQAAQREKATQIEREAMQEIEQEQEERTLEWKMQKEAEKIAIVEDEMDSFDPTYDNIKKNIREQYVAKYNKVNGTEYSVDDLSLSSFPTDSIFKTTDGRYVSHGDYPEVVRQYLSNKGILEKGIDMTHKNIYYSYVDGEILEMMTRLDEEGYVSVLEGDDIENKINDFSENTLLDMKEVMMTGLDWANEPDNASLKQRYVEAVRDFREEEKQEEEKAEAEKQSKEKETERLNKLAEERAMEINKGFEPGD